jgi:hypothetical protein
MVKVRVQVGSGKENRVAKKRRFSKIRRRQVVQGHVKPSVVRSSDAIHDDGRCLMQGHIDRSSEGGCLMISSKYGVKLLGPILTIRDVAICISNLGSKEGA